MKKTNLLRIITSAALILGLILSFAACATVTPQTSESPDPSKAASPDVTESATPEASTEPTAEKPVLTMATNAQFPPYEFYDGDAIVGIDAEIAALIADKLGMTLQIEDMEFDSVIISASTGKADIAMAGLTVREDRLKYVNFTTTYATGKQVIIVKVDSDIASPDDLEGKTIGVQLATTGDIYITGDLVDEGLASIERYNKGADAVQALVQGKIDAVVIDNEPAKVFVQQNEGLAILETEYAIEDYAIAVAKDNTELLDKVEAALQELIASGEVKTVVDKYINAE